MLNSTVVKQPTEGNGPNDEQINHSLLPKTIPPLTPVVATQRLSPVVSLRVIGQYVLGNPRLPVTNGFLLDLSKSDLSDLNKFE